MHRPLSAAAWSLCWAGCVLVTACAIVSPRYQKPNLSVIGIELLNGNLLQQNFRVRFEVQNPNDRALPVSGLHAALNVSGEQIASGGSDRAFVVPANGETEFDMLITANVALALLKFAAQRDQNADSIGYELTGVVHVDLPLLGDIPFHTAGAFSLKLPQ